MGACQSQDANWKVAIDIRKDLPNFREFALRIQL
jgi:hypothetical protein